MSHQLINSLLNFDPLSTAEQYIRRDYKSDDGTVLLGIGLMISVAEMKKKVLKEHDDTHFSLSFSEVMGVVTRLGFKEVHREIISGTDPYIIMWRNGILLTCESYDDGRTTNTINIYFNYQGPRDGMFRCSNSFIRKGDNGQSIWGGHCDVREGLRYVIEKMESSGCILETWIEQPFLWLLTYMDTKNDNYDYGAINASRITRLPAEVQKAIQPIH
jgi:hypothetical protein